MPDARPLPPFPTLELSSELLRGLIDGVIHGVWSLLPRAGTTTRSPVACEVDALEAEILEAWSDESFDAFARQDQWAKVGLHCTGIEEAPDAAAHVRRRFAYRIIEIASQRAIAELNERAMLEPASSDRVFAVADGLWDELDSRHFLMPLTADRVPTDVLSNDGFFYYRDWAVFPHPQLRPLRELVGDLCHLALEGLPVSVAIDPHRVTACADAPQLMLLDYWFGVRVTKETLDSVEPHALGRAIHWRDPESSQGQINDLIYPLLATEFEWAVRDNGVKIFRVDEIRPPPAACTAEETVRSRFAHSERDTARRQFIHLDGAIKTYPAADYQPSSENPLASLGKAATYRKLFRIDGDIPEDDWGRVIGHFFRNNELIAEHLGDLLDERA